VGAGTFKGTWRRHSHTSLDGAGSFDWLAYSMPWEMMRSLVAGRSVRLPAEAIVALLACFLLAPTKVQAGCASNAPHWSVAGQPEGFVDPVVVRRGEPSRNESAPATKPDRPPLCSGPACSGNSTPPAVPSASEALYVEPWACLGRTVALPEPHCGFAAVSSLGLHSVLAPATIFHPPRRIPLRSYV
jgi:hypothetical protein